MAVVDLVDLVDQRKVQIGEDDADIRAEETYFAGEGGIWCLLTLWDDAIDELLGYEFIETAESWRRPDAVLEYNEASIEGTNVVVIVPDDAFVEATELIMRAGDPEIIVSDYSAMELTPRVLAG